MPSRAAQFIAAVCLVGVVAAPCLAARPSRADIAAHAARCKSEDRDMDLVARFGSDFSGLDLSGLDLRGAHRVGRETLMKGANFARANLQGVQFGAAVLDDASFAAADLSGADFVTATLLRVD